MSSLPHLRSSSDSMVLPVLAHHSALSLEDRASLKARRRQCSLARYSESELQPTKSVRRALHAQARRVGGGEMNILMKVCEMFNKTSDCRVY